MNCIFDDYIKFIDSFLCNYYRILLGTKYERRLVRPFVEKYINIRYYNEYVVKESKFTDVLNRELNNIAKEIEEMIKSNKLYIINIKGICYERDYISGEIIEYPFEDMDPTQIIEPFENSEISILEVTSNKRNLLSNTEILEAITKFK